MTVMKYELNYIFELGEADVDMKKQGWKYFSEVPMKCS